MKHIASFYFNWRPVFASLSLIVFASWLFLIIISPRPESVVEGSINITTFTAITAVLWVAMTMVVKAVIIRIDFGSQVNDGADILAAVISLVLFLLWSTNVPPSYKGDGGSITFGAVAFYITLFIDVIECSRLVGRFGSYLFRLASLFR